MNIFLKEDRAEYIELLEFFYFLRKLYFSSVNEYGKTSNPFIIDFLNLIQNSFSQELKKISDYMQALEDVSFWESKEFYRETMQKFIAGELSGLEFAEEFSDRLLLDKSKSKVLLEDFKKQADIELDPKSFKFSTIILNFELMLEVYQNEMEELEMDDEFSENDLSFSENSIKEGVKRELEKVNKYFAD